MHSPRSGRSVCRSRQPLRFARSAAYCTSGIFRQFNGSALTVSVVSLRSYVFDIRLILVNLALIRIGGRERVGDSVSTRSRERLVKSAVREGRS